MISVVIACLVRHQSYLEKYDNKSLVWMRASCIILSCFLECPKLIDGHNAYSNERKHELRCSIPKLFF